MAKVKVKTQLLNDLNEGENCEVEGFYDLETGTINYYDNNVYVTINNNNDVLTINREHPEYNICLKFAKNNNFQTSYKIRNIDMDMVLETQTHSLIMSYNNIYIKYRLLLNNEDMGLFEFKLHFEEEKMDTKKQLHNLIRDALLKLNVGNLDITIEMPKDSNHGDYATNIAMQLSKEMGLNPREIANSIINNIEKNNLITKTEIAGPGFINFWIDKKQFLNVISDVIKQEAEFGRSALGNGEKINVEFVSANPTGFLHLGHARGAAYGDCLCRILDFAGYKVDREYYINDDGNQINNLGISLKERYRGLCGLEENMPTDGYFGQEVIEIAKSIYDEYKDQCLNHNVDYFKEVGIQKLLAKIKNDLEKFRVTFNLWTSERTIREKGRIEEALAQLKKLKKTYELENALWLKSTDFGDEKDRVLVKNDGEYAYITPDIANHLDKFDRGNDVLIDVFGADHHGYVPRLKAAIEALGYEKDKLEVKIIQMVRLFKGHEEVKMSKRTGKVVTMNDLIDEVGVDATRYFFAMRNIDTQLDFDMELATKKSNENPVYYVQYAHARICSILRDAHQVDLVDNYETIDSPYAYNILAKMQQFKEVIEISALKRLPHLITNYVYELAELFHAYYAQEKILTNDERSTQERILLIKAVKITIKNALNLIGVEALDKM